MDTLPVFETPEGATVRIDGETYDWFRGSGYLGLYGNPEILQAACEATLRYGMKLRAKRQPATHPCILELERNACRFFATEASAYFNSGYCSNAVLLAALHEDYDCILIDGEAHYSIVDAVKASAKPYYRFAHLDADDLKKKLALHVKPSQRPLLMSDAVFPVSGKMAPIPDYWAAIKAYDQAMLCLDDAHGAGVLGENGRGTLEHFGIDHPRCRSSFTLSKAFGAFGGLLAIDAKTMAKVDAHSGIRKGASPPPPGVVAAAAKALELAWTRPELRHSLTLNVSRVRKGLSALGFDIDSQSPVPIMCLEGRGVDLESFCDELFKRQKIALLYMKQGYPGIPKAGALVFTVFASHTSEQIERLLDAFKRHI